eukprot:m.86971 g.86971  ORF g.86971 m.86971 type:complete len:179 (+) comp8778_c0_seq1:331-867(+)
MLVSVVGKLVFWRWPLLVVSSNLKKFYSTGMDEDHVNYVQRGREFELLCGGLMKDAGVENVVVQGQTGDGGIDIIGLLNNCKIIVQCKKTDKRVGVNVVRELEGTLLREESSTIGIVCSSVGFSKGAKELVVSSKFPLMLWTVAESGSFKSWANPRFHKLGVRLQPQKRKRLVIQNVS